MRDEEGGDDGKSARKSEARFPGLNLLNSRELKRAGLFRMEQCLPAYHLGGITPAVILELRSRGMDRWTHMARTLVPGLIDWSQEVPGFAMADGPRIRIIIQVVPWIIRAPGPETLVIHIKKVIASKGRV